MESGNQSNSVLDVIKSIASDMNLPGKVFKTIENLIGPAINETGQLMADVIRHKRLTNQAKFFIKFQTTIESQGYQLKQLPDNFILPLIENVGVIDNEDLQEKWLNLLLNATQTDDIELYPLYSDLLRQISSMEVKMLDELYLRVSEKEVRTYEAKDNFIEAIGVGEFKGSIYLDNLARLNLIEYIPQSGSGLAAVYKMNFRPSSIRLTALGKNFVECCGRYQ